jgi:uncharacterized alpha-E superfamily protein
MSRYLERAEHTVRMIDVNVGLMLDKSSTSAEGRWERVLAAMGSPEDVAWEGDLYKLVSKLCFDEDVEASVLSCIVSARENARQVREEISTEQWQRLNRLFHQVTQRTPSDRSDTEFSDFLACVIEGVHLFQGVTDTNMSHGEGWQFIQVGRYIERASETAILLQIYQRDFFNPANAATEDFEYLELVGLLRTCTAFEAYCKVHTADLSHDRILEFLLLDGEFPHSLRYSIDHLHRALEAIHRETARQPADDLLRLAGRMKAALNFVQISEILDQDAEAYLRAIVMQCRQVHDLLYQNYIHYSVQTALAV